MKQVFSLLAALILVTTLGGCARQQRTSEEGARQINEVEPIQEEK